MRQIILMRHAKTEPWHEGVDDAGRPLTERGKRDAAAVAVALRAAGLVPDRVLLSSARRTRETWSQMSASLSGAAVRVLDELYLAEPDEIIETISGERDYQTLLVIGHNPGLHDLVSELARMGKVDSEDSLRFVIDQLPTGTAVVFEMPEQAFAPGETRMTALYWGRDLAEGATGAAG